MLGSPRVLLCSPSDSLCAPSHWLLSFIHIPLQRCRQRHSYSVWPTVRRGCRTQHLTLNLDKSELPGPSHLPSMLSININHSVVPATRTTRQQHQEDTSVPHPCGHTGFELGSCQLSSLMWLVGIISLTPLLILALIFPLFFLPFTDHKLSHLLWLYKKELKLLWLLVKCSANTGHRQLNRQSLSSPRECFSVWARFTATQCWYWGNQTDDRQQQTQELCTMHILNLKGLMLCFFDCLLSLTTLATVFIYTDGSVHHTKPVQREQSGRDVLLKRLRAT